MTDSTLHDNLREANRLIKETEASLAMTRASLSILKFELAMAEVRRHRPIRPFAPGELVSINPDDTGTVDRLLMAFFAALPVERPDGSIRHMQAALRSLNPGGAA